METLIDIFKKYDTDKDTGRYVSNFGHYYGDIYSEVFSFFDRFDKTLNLLEVGVQKGGSLLCWKDYFVNGNIFGVDISDCRRDDFKREDVTFILSDINKLNPNQHLLLKDKFFDILIDDGSHDPKDVIGFIKGYLPVMSERGFFIIEDVQDPDSWLPQILSNVDLTKYKVITRDYRSKNNRYDDYIIIITNINNNLLK